MASTGARRVTVLAGVVVVVLLAATAVAASSVLSPRAKFARALDVLVTEPRDELRLSLAEKQLAVLLANDPLLAVPYLRDERHFTSRWFHEASVGELLAHTFLEFERESASWLPLPR